MALCADRDMDLMKLEPSWRIRKTAWWLHRMERKVLVLDEGAGNAVFFIPGLGDGTWCWPDSSSRCLRPAEFLLCTTRPRSLL